MNDLSLSLVTLALVCILILAGLMSLINSVEKNNEEFNKSQKLCMEKGFDFAVNKGVMGGIFCGLNGKNFQLNVKDLNLIIVDLNGVGV